MPRSCFAPFSASLCLLLLLLFASSSPGTENTPDQKGPPPALVAAAELLQGTVETTMPQVGTLFFDRISRVASEVSGLVQEVTFKEGQKITAGSVLARLDTGLLDTSIAGTVASLDQARLELEKADHDLTRAEQLKQERSLAPIAYDEYFYTRQGLTKKVASLQSSVDRLLLEKKKMRVIAPFDGVIIAKNTEQGEWLAAGTTVAVLADNRRMEAVFNVSESLLAFLTPARSYSIQAGGRTLAAKLSVILPKGDIASRTFTVKFLLTDTTGFFEGMEAYSMLPAGDQVDGLLAPRDAVIQINGKDTVFIIGPDNTAQPITVTITGTSGFHLGIAGPALAAGTRVVTKGHERLRPGQTVMVTDQAVPNQAQ